MKPIYIIAEAGVNHNGSLKRACELVDAAVEAGADAVKFQTFRAEAVVSTAAPKADYQVATTGEGSQLEMIRALELSYADFSQLAARARVFRIDFLSSPFDIESVNFLANVLNVPAIKIASGEITNAPLLFAAACTGRAVLLSTGMSTLDDVQAALQVLARGYAEPLHDKVTLLHCTTEYPTPLADVNLRAMVPMGEAFCLPVGYSDHTTGITVPIAAATLGATVIEKHLTLDRRLPGPDHRASLEPHEFVAMVRAIRDVERALGSSDKVVTPSEVANRAVARRSLVAAQPIRAGEAFTPENVTAKRPGTGISPMRYWDVLGQCAGRDYQADELI